MANTIVEKMYPQETFVTKIEELGFAFEGYGWSGEDDEDYGSQEYWFSFPFKPYEDEEEEKGQVHLMIKIHDQKVSFDVRVAHGRISEKSRVGISKVVHELVKKKPKDMEKITLHGVLIKDMDFYKDTLIGLNKEKLIELAGQLEFQESSSQGLYLHGIDGKVFANILMDLYEGFEVVPYHTPTEHTTSLYFPNNQALTISSHVSLSTLFST